MRLGHWKLAFRFFLLITSSNLGGLNEKWQTIFFSVSKPMTGIALNVGGRGFL